MTRHTLWHPQAFALLHNAQGTANARVFTRPVGAIEVWRGDDVAPALDALDDARARGLHAVGYIAYEAGLALEPRLRPRLREDRTTPLISFGLFDAPAPLEEGELTRRLGGDAALGPMAPDLDLAAYTPRFDEVRRLIAAGDVYQINLTFALKGQLTGDPVALFQRLQQRAQARYGALLSLRDRHVLSLSPELFLESDGATIRARPMKGTAPRAARAADDSALAAALAADDKTRAENMMIVDLLRNDLSRIATTGSVRATSLYDIETYPTLHQMTSTVEADLKPRTSLRDILKATFPCGSVTGAPKIRAMEIIDDLENAPRNVYCGAVGHLGPEGALRLNVSIRTLTVSENGAVRFGVGSGLVFDSDARAEYAECLLKARFLDAESARPSLFETLRLEKDRGYTRLDAHIERICASARRLGYPHDEHALRTALTETMARNDHALARVRLVLDPDGAVSVNVQPFDDTRAGPLRLLLSPLTVSSTDPLLYHKTTTRALYDGERARLAGRCDEVIFRNERGELTEGSFTNLFIERGGVLLTPAVACGLLPGTLRRHLIDTGAAREAVLRLSDLESAERIFVGNTLRGLVPAVYLDRT